MVQRAPLVSPNLRKKAEAPVVPEAAAAAFIESAPDGESTRKSKPATKKQPVTMKYPEDLLELIDSTALESHMTRTTFVMQALRNELKRLGKLV